MTIDELRALCAALAAGDEGAGDEGAAEAVRVRQGMLTKPPGSLGRLEELVAWLARWQRRERPVLDPVEILVFAGNHGVVAQGVSPYPADVTAQMVGNFEAGGAAINQIAGVVGARLRVVALSLESPTGDMTVGPAMDEAGFSAAVTTGFEAVRPGTGLLALGEMGIGNTTAAAALAAGLFGGDGAQWAGRGTGVDDAGLRRKQAAVDAAVALHAGRDPLGLAAALGGRELAAILGAVLAARVRGVPVVLDGFVATAAAAPLGVLVPGGLDHVVVGHLSAEAGHRALCEALGQVPLLSLGLRLGEASGAGLAVPLLRAAVACHEGMATFAQAGVSGRDADPE